MTQQREVESMVVRCFRDACVDYNELRISGMLNEVSPMELLLGSVSVLHCQREKEMRL